MAEILTIREQDNVTIVELLSDLDRLSVLSMKNQVTELAKKRRKKFIIDFSNIDHINSTVVGTLVGMRDIARRRSGDLVLCCVKPNIRRTFDLIGASRILKIYETEEEALENI
jgi:anti-anti-sigma factor